MSKKYLIISIVSLILVAGGIGAYYLLGIEEEMGEIPPIPVIQNTETSTGVSEVRSGEENTNSGYIDFPDGNRILKSEARLKLVEEFTDEASGTKYRAYMARLTIQKKGSKEIDLYLLDDWIAKPEFGNHNLSLSPDKSILLFNFVCGNSHCINGIIIDSKEILWNNHDSGDVKWSPDGKNIAIITNVFERISIRLSSHNNIRDLREVMIGRNIENANFYWESNDIFVYKPNIALDESGDYYRKAIMESGLDPVINRFSVRDTNSTSFSPSQISEILTKINENTKEQEEIRKNAIGVLVQGDFRAEYIPSKDNTDDKIKITNNGKSYSFPLKYNELNKKIKENKRGDDVEKFLYFNEFSPSNHYLLYTVWVGGYGSHTKYLIDVADGTTLLKIDYYSAGGIWTLDKKQFLYANEFGGLMITKRGEFPKTENIGGKMIFNNILVDENYIYGTCFPDRSGTPKYLKIYDLKTLKEVFSQEIK